MTRARHALALILLAALIGCAGKHLLTTALYVRQVGKTALTAQKIVTDVHAAADMTDASYRTWQTGFLKLGLGIKAINAALETANEQAVLKQVVTLTDLLQNLVDVEIPKLPEGKRAIVLVALEAVRSVLLSIAATWGNAPTFPEADWNELIRLAEVVP